MFNPHDVSADLLEAMADEAEYFLSAMEAVLNDDEWAEAFRWEDASPTMADEEAPYWAAEDARYDSAEAAITAGLVRLEEEEAAAEAVDDRDPDPAAPAAMPARWWIALFERQRDRAGWQGNVYGFSEAQRRLTCLERDFTAAQVLERCLACQGGWDEFDRYALCSSCDGSGFVPVMGAPSARADAA
jgi:hypothetical protein